MERVLPNHPGTAGTFAAFRLLGVPVRLHFTFVLLMIFLVVTDLGHQSSGTFALNASLEQAINGSPLADGIHTLHLKALDSKGVVLGSFDLPITLDSVAPAQPVFDLDPSVIAAASLAAW